jgi:Arc/MetJ-type ribon-helix-helix transcriptional regulator
MLLYIGGLMRVNRTLGTSVPPEVEKQIEALVKKGYYKTKSDFLYQAVLEKLKNEKDMM